MPIGRAPIALTSSVSSPPLPFKTRAPAAGAPEQGSAPLDGGAPLTRRFAAGQVMTMVSPLSSLETISVSVGASKVELTAAEAPAGATRANTRNERTAIELPAHRPIIWAGSQLQKRSGRGWTN